MSKPVVIGVVGGSGAGKTTFVLEIITRFKKVCISVLQQDSYYKDQNAIPPCQRSKINYDHPDTLDTELLVAHLNALRSGKPVDVPIYDFLTHTRKTETRLVYPSRVVIVEGILILAVESLRRLLDIKIFIDSDPDTRFIRRLLRDTCDRGRSLESVIEQYKRTVRPMHFRFVEPSKRYADIIVPESGFKTVAVDMVVTKIKSVIDDNSR